MTSLAINLTIALKALRQHKLQALLTLCGMSVGVAMVVIVAGLGQGAQSTIEAQLESAGPTEIAIRAGNFVPAGVITSGEQDSSGGEPGEGSQSPYETESGAPDLRPGARTPSTMRHRTPALPLGDAEVKLVRSQIANVRQVAAGVAGNLRVDDASVRARVVRAHGIEASWPDMRGWKMVAGRAIDAREFESGAPVALLTPGAARRLWPDDNNTTVSRTLRLGGREVTIIGVLKPQASADETAVVPSIYLPLSLAQQLLQLRSFDTITVRTTSVGTTTAVATELRNRLRTLRGLTPDMLDDFRVESQSLGAMPGRGMDPRLARAVRANVAGFEQASHEEIAKSLRQAGRTLTLLLVGAAAVSLVVGGIGVMNIMLVSVAARTREIGLRMAMGARTADVLTQFLAEAVALASLGGLAGLLLGSAALTVARHGLRWATAISPGMLLLALSVAALTGVAFGLGPARRAAALEPVVALRCE
jgi:putative ABC transport system permease protein